LPRAENRIAVLVKPRTVGAAIRRHGRVNLVVVVRMVDANGKQTQTKFNRRADRFQRRGRSACRSEWRLITATHNLLKLHRHQTAIAAA
jgi:hypothetical protein